MSSTDSTAQARHELKWSGLPLVALPQQLPEHDGDLAYLADLMETVLGSRGPLASIPPWFLYGAAMNALGVDAMDLLADWPEDRAAALLAGWNAESMAVAS